VPVTQVVTSPLSPISPVGQSNLSTLTASVTSASQRHYPTAAETTSISLPAGILDNHTSTTTSKAADCTSTTPTSTSCTDRNLSLPFGLVKSHLQVNSSSDSASSSSANNSPGSSLSISQKSNRKNKPNCRLHRNKQPNMLLAKVSEWVTCLWLIMYYVIYQYESKLLAMISNQYQSKLDCLRRWMLCCWQADATDWSIWASCMHCAGIRVK